MTLFVGRQEGRPLVESPASTIIQKVNF